MNIYSKLSSDALLNFFDNAKITDNLTPNIKSIKEKIGLPIIVSVLMATTGFAQAENVPTRNTMVGLAALAGLATHGKTTVNGQQVDCLVEGKNGLKIGGAGAIGALIGNQMGGGNGNKALTILGGIGGAALANASEEKRIHEACNQMRANEIAQNNLARGIPSYGQRSSSSQYVILYKAESLSGDYYYVNERNSPGMNVLRGAQQVGAVHPTQEPKVAMALNKTIVDLVNAHNKLEEEVEKYKYAVYGPQSQRTRFDMSFNVNPTDRDINQYKQQTEIKKEAIYNMNVAISDYTSAKGLFAKILDTAVVSGYDVTELRNVNYNNKRIIDLFNPPANLRHISQDLFKSNEPPNYFATINKYNQLKESGGGYSKYNR